jgi:hypothetical protein
MINHPNRSQKAKLLESASEQVISYKGFDKDFSCRGFKFEIGGSYTHEGPVVACESGFHACEHPLDIFNYYAPAESRFARVVQSGELSRHEGDTKIASGKITIEAEIKLPEIIAAAVKWVFDRAKPEGTSSHAVGTSGAASATGYSGAASATGYRGAASATSDSGAASATGTSGAASATGYSGAASATGDSGAASATGYRGAASATGDSGAASATGYRGAASATGTSGAASATGDSGAASATGTSGAASATGTSGAASATGYRGAASATGTSGAASATGYRGRAMGKEGCALFLIYHEVWNGPIIHVWAGIVGQNGIKPEVWYVLGADGQPVEQE